MVLIPSRCQSRDQAHSYTHDTLSAVPASDNESLLHWVLKSALPYALYIPSCYSTKQVNKLVWYLTTGDDLATNPFNSSRALKSPDTSTNTIYFATSRIWSAWYIHSFRYFSFLPQPHPSSILIYRLSSTYPTYFVIRAWQSSHRNDVLWFKISNTFVHFVPPRVCFL